MNNDSTVLKESDIAAGNLRDEVSQVPVKNELYDSDSESHYTFATEVISPKYANELLQKSRVRQRAINKNQVDKFVLAMKNGLWSHGTGECIKITEDGDLCDGQHRLSAVVKAGIDIKMLVMRGMNPDLMMNLDDGKSRTFANILDIRIGEEKTNSSRLASATRLILTCRGVLERGVRLNFTNETKLGSLHLGNASLLREYNNYPDLTTVDIEYGLMFSRSAINKIISPTAGLVFWYLYRNINREVAFNILITFAGGVSLEKGSSALAYREAILMKRLAEKRFTAWEYLQILIHCFDKDDQGLTIKQVKTGECYKYFLKQQYLGQLIKNTKANSGQLKLKV